MSYHQLNINERCCIYQFLKLGMNIRLRPYIKTPVSFQEKSKETTILERKCIIRILLKTNTSTEDWIVIVR